MAGPADRAEAVGILSLAFQNDPALTWIIPDADHRRARLPLLFETLFKSDLKAGKVVLSGSGEACALWRAPGVAEPGATEMLRHAIPLLRIFGSGLGRGNAVSKALDAHRPRNIPFWYLHFVGVHPDFQGQGWGGDIIREGLKRADADGQPTYLETATPQNVPLYLRLGFSIINEWDVPKGGPHFWSMLRDVGGARPA